MNIKFPSRSSWFRALLLIFTRAIILLLATHFLNTLPRGSVRTLASIGVWVGFSTLMGLWRHLFSVFRNETKFWKIQVKSIVEVVDALKVSFLTDLIALGLGLFVFFVLGSALKLNAQDAEIFLGLTMCLVLVIWFFSIPVLYERAAAKRKSKVKVTKKTKTEKS